MKRTALLRGIALVLACALCIACAAVASAAPAPGVIGENEVIRATAEEVAEVDKANAPRVTTMSNGVQIQRTPFSTKNVYQPYSAQDGPSGSLVIWISFTRLEKFP